MSRWTVRFAVAGVGALMLFMLGPVPSVDAVDAKAIAKAVPDEPAEIDAWLAAGEAKVSGITPGAEKGVVWAKPGTKTPVSFVYVHGFSATRREISPVMETVGAELGANVFFTRLAGHGLPGERLGDVTATDWMVDVVEAIEVGKALGEKVVLVGTSTGATVVLTREARVHDPSVAGIVALSPNFGPKNTDAELLLWPWVTPIAAAAMGDRTWEPRNEAQGRHWTTRYPTTAIGPMMATVQAARHTDLGKLAAPTLLVVSACDDVVDIARTDVAWAGIPDEKRDRETIVCAPGEDGHVPCGDILGPHRNELVGGWIADRARRWTAPAPASE